MFDTVLVANRGEIAVRIIRTLRSLGVRSVAVYSDADAGAPHVALADAAVRLGPAEPAHSYLSIPAILHACRASGAQGVHPGYGFLSENAQLARALADAGITFIGPPVAALELMGDKIRAKNHVAGHGVPVVPGVSDPTLTDAQLIAAAPEVGFPLLIKPSAGGGGKGMVAVHRAEDLPAALASARRTARSAFGDDTLLLERLVSSPRHIEVQLLADTHGHTIHLGERECSLQRRHQKVIEEAPAPLLENLPHGAKLRERLGAAAVAAARSVGYVGAGTVEFLVSDQDPDDFFFMEMNTRLQVEHPVTEAVVRAAGQPLDLVEQQLRIAAGHRVELSQEQITLSGHAVEARLYAEDPAAGFLPSAGTVRVLHEPSGPGIRVDSSLAEGLVISPHYDPLLAKLIARAGSRADALAALDRALEQTVVLGVRTNAEYLRLLLADADVAAGHLDTTLIERRLPQLRFSRPTATEAALAALLVRRAESRAAGAGSAWETGDGWRLGAAEPVRRTVDAGADLVWQVELLPTHDTLRATVYPLSADAGESAQQVELQQLADGRFAVDGVVEPLAWHVEADTCWLHRRGHTSMLQLPTRRQQLEARLAAQGQAPGELSPHVTSPMPGTVIALNVSDGQRVTAGQSLLAVEAMKMEHQLRAPADGTVELSALTVGSLVKAGQVLATVHAAAHDDAVQEDSDG